MASEFSFPRRGCWEVGPNEVQNRAVHTSVPEKLLQKHTLLRENTALHWQDPAFAVTSHRGQPAVPRLLSGLGTLGEAIRIAGSERSVRPDDESHFRQLSVYD